MSEALRRQDDAARLRARTEFAVPLVVEAGAGTGKTATLISRILLWILGPGWEKHASPDPHPGSPSPDPDTIAKRVLEGVVGITFTDKAAAEMAERAAKGLFQFQAGEIPIGIDKRDISLAEPTLQLRTGALLRNLDQLRVTTIHAFCNGVLSTYPIDAGLHPDFSVDADSSAARLAVAQAVWEVATQNPPHPRVLELMERGVELRAIQEIVEVLLSEGANATEFATELFQAETLQRIRAHVHALFVPVLATIETPVAASEKAMKKAERFSEAARRTADRLQSDLSADELASTIQEFWASNKSTWTPGKKGLFGS